MLKCVLLALSTLTLAAQGAPPSQPAPAAKEAPVKVLNAPAPQGNPPGHPAEAPKVEPVPETQVIGRLGKRIILEKDLHDWMKAVAGAKQFETYVKNVPMMANVRQKYLENLVLAAKARKSGLEKAPEFASMLSAKKDEVLITLMMNQDRAGSKGAELKEKAENPSEEEIQAYFEKNAQRYETPEKFSARHILVGIKGAPRMGDKGLTEEEAKAKIEKIQGELKAGKTFEEAAKEYSDDPSNKNSGGLIKDASFGGFAKEFEDAVHKQEIGKVGEPVKTSFGYHLIVVESVTPKQAATLEKVRDRVKQQMTPERRDTLTKAFIEDAKKEMDFVAGPDAAASLPKAAPKAKAVKK